MIIGISGKIGSGKDTVGKIIQYLTIKSDNKIVEALHETKEIDIIKFLDKWNGNQSDWQIKKFAGKLKQIVSILTGISVEDLEKQEVKDRLLGEDWTRYGYADGFSDVYKDGVKVVTMMNKECSKERYEDAISSGNAAVIVEESEKDKDLLKMTIGGIQPAQEVTVKIQLIKKLEIEAGAYALRIPTAYFIKFGNEKIGINKGIKESEL